MKKKDDKVVLVKILDPIMSYIKPQKKRRKSAPDNVKKKSCIKLQKN